MHDGIIELVDGYRGELDLKARLARMESIYFAIEKDLRLFLFGRLNPSQAEDVLQTTFCAIFENLYKFRGKTDSKFRFWCYQIARNKANDEYRRASRMQTLPSEEFLRLVEASAEIEPISVVEKLDLEDALKLLDKKKPKCREILWNRVVNRMKYAEIGKLLRLRADAVRMNVNRCLAELVKLFKK